MSARKDLDALLAKAQQQGAEVTFTKTSHRRVRFKGRTVIVSGSPHSYGGVLAARRDLRKIGLDV